MFGEEGRVVLDRLPFQNGDTVLIRTGILAGTRGVLARIIDRAGDLALAEVRVVIAGRTTFLKLPFESVELTENE